MVTTRSVSSSDSRNSKITHGRMELDSHADTVVFGRNCALLHFTGRECDVSPYTDSYEAIKSVRIATAGTAYTSQETGQTYILVFHEGLWMGDKMEHSLINQNQLRHFGTTVQDNPFSTSPLYIMTEDSDFSLPLQVDGTNIFLNTRTPTARELSECPHIEMTSQHPWDPHTVRFPESSRSVREEIEMQRTVGAISTEHQLPETEIDQDSIIFDLGDINTHIISSAKVTEVPRTMSAVEIQDEPAARTFESTKRHTDVSAEDLSERRHILILSINLAKRVRPLINNVSIISVRVHQKYFNTEPHHLLSVIARKQDMETFSLK